MTQQVSLDGFLSTLEGYVAVEEEAEEEAAAQMGGDAGRCEACGEPDGPHSYARLRLHAGALKLYREGGRLAARADIDHVYHKCKRGLISNIRFLRRLFDYVSRSGKVLGVGKAFDDELYVYGVGNFPEAFEGFRLLLIRVEDMESLKRLHRYLEPVPEEVLREALGGEP